MKRNYPTLLPIVLALVTFACSITDDSDPLDVFREIAYNALPSNVKSTVVGDWRNAEVTAWVNGNYLVIFETNDPILGPVKVVVDPDRGTWVEILPRP
jgi:hypothetical protein